jgi:tetratricopeptide (TPR) repeat protein
VWAAIVPAAAIVMGAPTLKGTFVGGDDHRLVLNHVLVNHPSFSHAAKLFTIIHRDLYQPLPLLSFSMEFAVADLFGLFDEGLEGGEWLFHLTNIILHAINALLVWGVIMTWRGRADDQTLLAGWTRDSGRHALATATIAGLLFAVHPLQVEVVAWVNGRMMLMSTMFALASAISLGLWLRRNHLGWAIVTVLLVTACGMSKIRIGWLGVLILLPLVQGPKLTTKRTVKLIVIWLISGTITGALAFVNYLATREAGMFTAASEQLHGSLVARGLMALAWYFQHFVWPTGLAAWYPTPKTVQWSDPAVLQAVAIVLPCLVVMIWAARRSRVAAIGFAWFFATMAVTLVLVRTRNTLAADRYMYLPIVGFAWVVALAVTKAYTRGTAKGRTAGARVVAGVVGVASAAALIGMSWHTARFYNSFLEKTTRIAEKELVHQDGQVQSDAYVVIGLSQMELGRQEEGVATLRLAVERNPSGAKTKHHLAKALDGLGRVEEALPLYEQAADGLPLHNPVNNDLAGVYRRLGNAGEAERFYQKALRNNTYDVTATLGLAELDIDAGTPESSRRAVDRLMSLLSWMPENLTARVNLGVAYVTLGRTREAIEAYGEVLARGSPGRAGAPDERQAQITAALNLAQLDQSAGKSERIPALIERAVDCGVESISEAVAVHDLIIAQSAPSRAAEFWADFLQRVPDSVGARGFAAWSRALAGDISAARAQADSLMAEGNEEPLALATLAYVELLEERYEPVDARVSALCAMGDRGADARRRMLGALEVFDLKKPGVPWTYCLTAELLLADGRAEPARVFMELCQQHCRDDPACRAKIESLKGRAP